MKKILLTGLLMTGALTAYATLLDNFHNIPLTTFLHEFDGFKARGLGPTAFAIYNGADGHHSQVAGGFDAAHAQDQLKPDMDESDLSSILPKMAKQNFYARELAVGVNPFNGVAIFSAIFTKGPYATVSIYSHDDSRFVESYKKKVAQGYRPLTHIQWSELGTNRHQTTYIKDGKAFMFYFGVDAATFGQKGTELAAQGWQIDSMQITNSIANTDNYSGIWLKKSSAMQYFYDLTSAEYQQKWEELNAKGYRLKQVIGYGSRGEWYGGIWVK